ncbi:MAG: hypothetical protein D6B26_02585 [Spirochaetaceae bacterium]|nr:MAG: hypothetical protein D6B26_02585 [Spirochaetaceae bacterium]
MRVRGILFLMVLLCMTGVVSLTAQSRLDNPEMQKSREYQAMADQAFEEGEYEKAVEYSQLSAEYAERGEATAEKLALGYRANSMRNRASSRIYYAEQIGVQNRDAEAMESARAAFVEAETLLAENEYELSIAKSEEVLSTLAEFQPRTFVAPRPEPQEPAGDVLPQFYIVRLIPERRDCFWRIAEYDFVYGDPWLWPRLYEKNKQMLHDPENPDLIHPGMKFEIPARTGEQRSGIWNPQDAR